MAILEDIIKAKEIQFEIIPSPEHTKELKKVKADLKWWMKVEEAFWQQKAGMKWLKDGDRNTRFFYSYVKGRRRKLHIDEIHNSQGQVLYSDEEKGNAAVQFFSK